MQINLQQIMFTKISLRDLKESLQVTNFSFNKLR